MCFGTEVDQKRGGNRKRVELTFLTINERGKWSHLKTSLFSNEILEREQTLVPYPDLLFFNVNKEVMGEQT